MSSLNLSLDISIKNKIHLIRGKSVILDSDLADLYSVSVKVLNQSVKRNILRFPEDFMFRLSKSEFESLRSQIVTSNSERGGRRYLPFVFTEQGIATLSGILNSPTAIKVNIQIMRAFVKLREFMSTHELLFSRLNVIESNQLKYEANFNKLFDEIGRKELSKSQGIFYEDQIFDAYVFVSDLIKSAKKSIILIDNYVDDSVFTLFSKRKKGVSVFIYTKNISSALKLDLIKFNSQYESISLKKFNKSHDRFLIIDDSLVYHFGASLKDLGKKWFAFSKFEKDAVSMLLKLK